MSLSKDMKDEIKEVALSAVSELIDDGKVNEEEAIEILSSTLDALIPLSILLPGALGELAENADDVVFDEIAKALYKAFTLSPDKIELRAQRALQKGNPKVAARRIRRADRIRERRLFKNQTSS